jgi:type IV pilus assembly protein PilX
MPALEPLSVRTRQRGAALAIGLILLVVLTLLAFTGINAATTELAMAGNEQYRKNASQTASAGIEVAIANLRTVPTVAGASRTVTARPTPGSDDEYTTVTRFIGDEHGLPQSSLDKFVGLHYSIVSNSTSYRNARDGQEQGVFVVAPARAGEGNSYRQIGTGLP